MTLVGGKQVYYGYIEVITLVVTAVNLQSTAVWI